MADIYEITGIALATPHQGAAHMLAEQLCLARGQWPNDAVVFNNLHMERWKAVIAESLTLDAIRAEVCNNG